MDYDKSSDEKWNSEHTGSYRFHWKFCIPQILATCAAHSLVINCGINLVFSAILLPQLMAPMSHVSVTSEEASWIASLVTIATPIGAILTGPIMDKFGRKRGCIICAIIMSVSWISMAVSNSVPLLCFSRLISGISTGLSTVAMVYVSEITHPHARSALLCWNSVFFSLGILLTCISGSLLSWRSTAVCSACFCVFLVGLLSLLPESPHWFAILSKGNEDHPLWQKAESSIRWLYRNDLISMQEIENLKKIADYSRDRKPLTMSETLKCFQQKSILKPFFLLLGIFLFQQLSGAYVLIFYAVNLFNKVGGKLGTSIDALQALIIMGAIRFIMSLIVSVISHKLGRRPLLISSFLGMSVSSLVIGITQISSTYNNNQSDLFAESVDEGHLLPIVCLLLFVCFSALGVLVIPWTLPVELLPVQFRGVGGGIMVSWAYVLMFISVKQFPDIIHLIGIANIFFFLSFVSLMGIIYVLLLLPETLGKEFSVIQEAFL